MKTFPFVEALLKATTLAKNAPVSHVLPQLELFINFEAKNGFIGIDFAQWTGDESVIFLDVHRRACRNVKLARIFID